MKPQTTPIKSAEEMFREATEKHISENPNEDFFSIDEIMQSDETKVVLSVIHNFASLQTTAKEKEFCERLEAWKTEALSTKNMQRNAVFELMNHPETDEATREKCAAVWGFITGFKRDLQSLDELIQNYKK